MTTFCTATKYFASLSPLTGGRHWRDGRELGSRVETQPSQCQAGCHWGWPGRVNVATYRWMWGTGELPSAYLVKVRQRNIYIVLIARAVIDLVTNLGPVVHICTCGMCDPTWCDACVPSAQYRQTTTYLTESGQPQPSSTSGHSVWVNIQGRRPSRSAGTGTSTRIK